VVEELDLAAILVVHDEDRGYPPFHPAMMVALLLYAYTQGVFSSRKIARSCIERMDFAAVTGFQKPDFRTISQFRKRHLAALGALFQQVLLLCRKAGLVSLGHVALDGTKVRANASKHKAMTYDRMEKAEREFADLVKDWLDAAEVADLSEDCRFRNKKGDELPDWVINKVARMKKVREAMAALELEATEKAKKERKDNGYVATGRQKHGTKAAADPTHGKPGSLLAQMRERLIRGGWRSPYRLRKQIVEPVFGQIKQAMGFRQFLLRGLRSVQDEWRLVCLAHNLLKLVRATA
jgi:transposase